MTAAADVSRIALQTVASAALQSQMEWAPVAAQVLAIFVASVQ